MISVTPSGQGCDATVIGVDLASKLDPSTVGAIHNAWLTHHVLVFQNQDLDDTAFEIFADSICPIGADPFFAPIDGKKRIAAISQRADEAGPLFAEVWHSDWNFLETPPAGTCLYSITIPPSGSDTLFFQSAKSPQRNARVVTSKIASENSASLGTPRFRAQWRLCVGQIHRQYGHRTVRRGFGCI
ncbi:MAG: TauD/TfdA family dioxygenase [Pseudomonadota bacterium]|nr:TauD/TfdA family dioxygenase [Pseudomonadota bacterium]